MAATTIHSLLGLPDPAATRFADESVTAAYAGFLRQLVIPCGREFILADPYHFHLEAVPRRSDDISTWLKELPSTELAKLLLLSIFTRPLDISVLWPHGQKRLIDDESFVKMWVMEDEASLAEGRQGIGLQADTLLARRERGADPTIERLIRQVLRRAPIASFWSEFIGGQPGNFAYQMWQVARWSDDYAVVYAISDLAGQGWPFPWILGFVELAAVERSFIKFLRAAGQMYDIGFYASSASVEGDWPLATVALTGSDDLDGFPDWGVVDSLLSLEAEEIRALMDESALLGSADVLDRVSALLRQAIDAGLEGQDIKSLLTKADAGWSLDLLEDFLERCADE